MKLPSRNGVDRSSYISGRLVQCASYLALVATCTLGAGCQGTPSNFNLVSVTTTTPVITQGGTAMITGAVANDTSGDGVSWSLSGVGTLTNATKTTVTYQAPASVTTETVATVTATSVAFRSSSSQIQITIEPPPAVTTSSLPGANEGTNYNAQVNATGGVPPFSWSVTSGSLTAQLALNASSTRTVTISGIPYSQGTDSFTVQIRDALGDLASQPLSIAIGPPLPLQVPAQSLPAGNLNSAYPATTLTATGGVPPFTWTLTSAPSTFPPGLTLASNGMISGTPTTLGIYQFNVLVTDSETTAMTAPGTLTIEVDDLAALSGNYAFQFNGFDSQGNPVVAAGSFTLDGAGNITSGVEDTNGLATTPKNQTFTGTYTFNEFNQGLLTFSSLQGAPTYSFALDATETHGRIIEFDSSGIRGSGDLEKRIISTCSGTTFSGNYAFGLSGHEAPISGISVPSPVAVAGSFTATAASSTGTTGNIGTTELDANLPGKIWAQNKTMSGTFQGTSQTTRCSMTFSSSLPTMDFSVYPVSTTAAFLVETDDTASTSTPLLTTGTIQQQTGYPFVGASGSTFSPGVTSVGAFVGSDYNGTTFVPDVAIVSIAGTGGSSFTMSATENQAGTVGTISQASNFVLADQYGRVGTTSPTTPFAPVFYMISQNTAYAIGEPAEVNGQSDPFFGIFEPQTGGPFTANSIATAFVEGTTAPAAATVPDISGTVEFDSTTNRMLGLQNQSASGGNQFEQVADAAYSITDANAGTGTLAFSSPTSGVTRAFVIISPSQMVMITTTTGDANPVVVLFEQ